MEARDNPYAPGAGTPPPQLAGRDALLEQAAIALDRIRHGRAAKSLLLTGLRGVGKTVLLNRIAQNAEDDKFVTVLLEAPEDRPLPDLLAAPLRAALIKMDRRAAAGDTAKRALRALVGFMRAMKVSYQGVEIGVDLDSERGLADSGVLDQDLGELLCAAGAAARDQGTALVLFIDELQYVEERHLGALIAALHRTAQRSLPVTLMGAGLPQLVARTGDAKTYAERLFSFAEIGPLDADAAATAIKAPAERENVDYTTTALEAIVQHTQRYPYFLQEWGKHCWNCAAESPVTARDVRDATREAIKELDRSFFQVRFHRLTPSEKHYLRAMAELGSGPHRSGAVADVLSKSVRSVAPIRARLIAKGMIYSPAHGDTTFTVPLFDGFMKREMPDGIRGPGAA